MPHHDYHSNSATFALPVRLKDKTMHMFTLSNDGPSEFSLVISHADTVPEEKLEEFGSRLLRELDKALPKFQLRAMQERELDGSPAVELAYSWRNDGVFMHQRQVIALVQGQAEGSTQAILIAATCLKAFSDEWNAEFDALLSSVKLRHPLVTGAPAPVPYVAPEGGPALPATFALSQRRRTLHVFADRDEAARKTDAREVELDTWEFFNADGEPLQARFIIPNESVVRGKPGTYELVPARDADRPMLRQHLHHAAVLHCSASAAQFGDLDEVRAHLLRRNGSGTAPGATGQARLG